MLNKNLTKVIMLSVLCLSRVNVYAAEDAFSPINANDANKPVQNMENAVVPTTDAQTTQTLQPVQVTETQKPNELSGKASVEDFQNIYIDGPFSNLENATDKFVQCNIRTAWDDFKTLINTAPQNDFLYIAFANKMAELGLFDLSSLAISKIKDKDLANVSIDDMQRFYYPRRKLKLDDELLLAEAYSNILYNNQSVEATNELLENAQLLSISDYANYLVALGFYKSNNMQQAKKYINFAIIQNPSNINYQILKAEIFADSDDEQEVIKTVESLKKQDIFSSEYGRKIKSTEQFVLYKVKTAEWEKNYHLGYYYYLENDNSKAIRSLETALSSKKKSHTELVYALMSKIYLEMNEFEKASDTAKKAYKSDENNPLALITLGDLNYRDKNYKEALKYYKKAANQDKKSYIAYVKEAETYQELANVKKATEIYAKVLKAHSDSWEAYYNVALLDDSKKIIYLKKALAVNLLFENAWIELAKIEIEKDNYGIAQKYLANAYYIDENDFRYYYYQGLVNKNSGNYPQAQINFKKCLKLNSKFKEAQNELNSLKNIENAPPTQESM